jgi:glutamyl-tRNA synthetase
VEEKQKRRIIIMTETTTRVRFAPSPTGFLHVGGLRTALYNFLYARQNNGVFVLRIEDTDRNRFVPGAAEKLAQTLSICGIKADEGPALKGDKGPYVQSLRLPLYRRHAQQLIESGHAYHCFCTPERLAQMRDTQAANNEPLRYDGHCRHLTEAEREAKRVAQSSSTIRLRVPAGERIRIADEIRGTVVFESDEIDDQVLLKSDGYPTYHLANVVDDYHMGITHVIRGEEWLPSTPKHVLLYRAFNWELPVFAHLPLLLNPDRSKLSKRQGDVAVEDFLEVGFVPPAIVNFVALLGWNPGDDREFFTLAELEREFSLQRINKSGAVFDRDKFKWMNGQYLRQMADEDYIAEVLPFMDDVLPPIYSSAQLGKIAMALRNQIDVAEEISTKLGVFKGGPLRIADTAEQEMCNSADSRKVFALLRDKVLAEKNLTAATFKQMMKEVQKESGIKGKNLFMPVRLAITGQQHGPDLGLTVEIFGAEEVAKRLGQVLA